MHSGQLDIHGAWVFPALSRPLVWRWCHQKTFYLWAVSDGTVFPGGTIQRASQGSVWERGITSIPYSLPSVFLKLLSPGERGFHHRGVPWHIWCQRIRFLCFRVTSKATSPTSIRSWLSASKTRSPHCLRCADAQTLQMEGAPLYLSVAHWGGHQHECLATFSMVLTRPGFAKTWNPFSRWTNTPAPGCCCELPGSRQPCFSLCIVYGGCLCNIL